MKSNGSTPSTTCGTPPSAEQLGRASLGWVTDSESREEIRVPNQWHEQLISKRDDLGSDEIEPWKDPEHLPAATEAVGRFLRDHTPR